MLEVRLEASTAEVGNQDREARVEEEELGVREEETGAGPGPLPETCEDHRNID